MSRDRDLSQRTIWLAGLAVAAGAGVATAHGLYEVARSAEVPAGVAWLYPLITDGLALVAYASTARLTGSGRRYAAGIVILAAGLSGLAQAVYLAGGIGVVEPATLRFGVGYWPAVACALVEHLVHLVGRRPAEPAVSHPAKEGDVAAGQAVGQATVVGQASRPDVGQAGPGESATVERPAGVRAAVAGGSLSPRDRARATAIVHRDAHSGTWPTTRELAALAEVSRDIAGQVLRSLKALSGAPSIASTLRESSTPSTAQSSNGHRTEPPHELVQ